MIKFLVDTEEFAQLARLTQSEMARVRREAFEYFHDLTPERSGNAKRSTTQRGDSIQANYQYAGVLDAGRGRRDGQMRGSTQAPRGMSRPTAEHIEKVLIPQAIRRINGG